MLSNHLLIQKKWETELKDNYIILFRMHAYTNQLLGLEFNDTIRDYSAYPNVNDLFKVADILISDYSASMSDYAIFRTSGSAIRN